MGILDWLRGRPSGSPVPSTPASSGDAAAETRQYVEEEARRAVRAGYREADEIREDLVSGYRDDLPETELADLATRAIEDELGLVERRQRDWPAVTDYDRLRAAFDALEERGIVARENFACCGNCGNAEIGDEIDAAEQAGIAVRGFTFFHMQDTDAAVDGRGLYLAYGALDGEEESGLAIGREIVETLERSGLTTEWDGSWSRRILVPMDWRRRV